MKKYIKSDYDDGDYTNVAYQDMMTSEVEGYFTTLAGAVIYILNHMNTREFDSACDFITSGSRPENFKPYNNDRADEMISLSNQVLSLSVEAVNKINEAYDLLSDARDLMWHREIKGWSGKLQDELGL